MDELETLFSSRPRVKVLRTFLFQPDRVFSGPEIAQQTGVAPSTARTHARDLSRIDFLEQVDSTSGSNGKAQVAWHLNKNSKMRKPLHELILLHQDTDLYDIQDQLSQVGNLSLLLATGVLVGVDDQPLDILIVGDNIDDRQLQRSLSRIESALGTELRYSQFSPEEFEYRLNIYDKLIQDVLEKPHTKLVDEIGVEQG